jgi:hypothetical protein
VSTPTLHQPSRAQRIGERLVGARTRRICYHGRERVVHIRVLYDAHLAGARARRICHRGGQCMVANKGAVRGSPGRRCEPPRGEERLDARGLKRTQQLDGAIVWKTTRSPCSTGHVGSAPGPALAQAPSLRLARAAPHPRGLWVRRGGLLARDGGGRRPGARGEAGEGARHAGLVETRCSHRLCCCCCFS